ncbi:Ig-like domain-containing protein [Candidatus Microgenomates bacterium]|nr:Ig-like domain-containing protein [Candidatus Microgenomates bacterium]
MPKRYQSGVVHLLVLVILLVGLVIGLNAVRESTRLFSQAASASPKVLLLIYNPVLENQGGSKLTAYKGWNEPSSLSQTLVGDFAAASAGKLSYTIAQTVELDGYPIKNDGFQYTDETYLSCVSSGGSNCHSPDGADYVKMLEAADACGKRNRGEIDEVWFWGGPWFGFWESNLAGPGGFWYNSNPTSGTTCEKLLPVMGFNYERGEAEALESYGHRLESTMRYVYGSWEAKETHAWNRFSLLDVDVPGRGGCGNAHLAVNAGSNTGYETTNSRTVPSSCEDFTDYPNLTGTFNDVTCNTWGCNPAGYLKWWYSHMPRADGTGPDNRLNNWWAYLADPQSAITDSALPLPAVSSSSTPSPTPSPTPTPTPSPSPSPTPTSSPQPTTISDATPPIVVITAPLNNTTVKKNSRLTIKVTALDNSGISKVEFSINSELKCTDSISDYTCDWKVPARARTTYAISAKAYDKFNNSAVTTVNVTSSK